MLGEGVYSKSHHVEAKWPDLSRARPEIQSGYSQLTFEKKSHLLRAVGKMKAVFLSPGEKGEGPICVQMLAICQNTDGVYFSICIWIAVCTEQQ